ncbi:MAG: iron-containing alcohol dehydrogenase [Gemmataceae bacterium]|nr:iron-containing alcohol dehydrogenase [Gemmataceae bacterium]
MKATSSRIFTVNEHFNRQQAVPLPPFDFTPLNRVVCGPGTLARLGELTKELGGNRVLLVTDRGLLHAGHPQRAEKALRDAGLEVFIYDETHENPSSKEVAEATLFAKQKQIDFIVAVGGGSSMDCAKGINFIYTNGGTMADYKGFGKATKPMLPSIGVPTTAGTGSEAQSYALISDEKTHLKMACGDKKVAFRIAILDPELTLSQPHFVTSVTAIDAIAHAIESYVCTKRNPVSAMYSLTAWHYLEPNLPIVLQDPSNLPARQAMQVGSHFAGVAIENAMLGITHSCANPLTAHYGITHGTAIGILLPHVIRFNESATPLYADLARSLKPIRGESPGETLARKITELVQMTGQPTRLRELEVSESILPLLALEASEQWTAKFNPRPVTEGDLLTVYQAAW